MSSNEPLERARRLIRKNQDVFDALLEYERTKKLPKLKRKTRIDVTVDRDLLREFRRLAPSHGAKLSPIVEMRLREQVREWRKGP